MLSSYSFRKTYVWYIYFIYVYIYIFLICFIYLNISNRVEYITRNFVINLGYQKTYEKQYEKLTVRYVIYLFLLVSGLESFRLSELLCTFIIDAAYFNLCEQFSCYATYSLCSGS